tara:strand:- start:6012 stop:7844 length:1833 start_codon:yes stop_codon:yes gene_type:complete
MSNKLTLLALTTLFATTANAQCLSVSGNSITATMAPTGFWTVDDEGRSPDIAFNGFTFPLGGTNWTHFVVESNGEVYLTNGSGPVSPATFGITNLATLRGGAGGSPRLAAFGGDFEGVSGLVGWDILVDDTVANQVKVTWTGLRLFNGSENFSMSLTLLAGGLVQFDYADGDFGSAAFNVIAGLSAGNDVGTGAEPPLDLNGGGDSGAVELFHEINWAPWDLDNQSILLLPNGNGGYAAVISCGEAGHESFGEGCYNIGTESFYQHFTDAAVAATALTGNALQLSPSSNGYVATWLAGGSALYVAPSAAATQLQVLNDDEVTFTPSAGFPTPNGTVTDLTVTGNGVIAFGMGPTEPSAENWIPTPAGMLAGSHGGIYCWHAYNEEEGGDVWAEEVGGITYVTFLDVENFPLGVVNPSTFQVQFDQASGQISIVWVDIDNDNVPIFGIYPQDHLIGFTPPGPSIDPGSVDLAAQLVVVTFPDTNAISISASPLPISTATTGTTVTYAIDNAPEVAANSGTAIGLVAFSLNGGLPGVDLGFLGAPGCSAYVGGLDLTLAFVGPIGQQTVPLTIPPGVPGGVLLYAQAAALSNGINVFGLATSNGIESTIGGS